jgi:hypothetical protein
MRNFKTRQQGFFVGEMREGRRLLSGFATGYCALDDELGRIPLESQDGHRTFHRLSHLQDFHGEAFEEQRQEAMGFRPWNAHGPNAARGTVHTRNAGNQNGLELAGIQLSPLAFLPMIVAGEMLNREGFNIPIRLGGE